MNRALIGATIGIVCAILLIAGLGAWDGFNNGISTNGMPSGLEAALLNACIYVMFFWPVLPSAGRSSAELQALQVGW
jgi:hypothetical protein